jgi:hypothetical protein
MGRSLLKDALGNGFHMKQIIELNVPNTLKKEGVKGIFYEGRTICVSFKHQLITLRVNK